MRYKLRKNADSGVWLSFLLPLCLFPLSLKTHLDSDKLMFVVVTWLSVSQVIAQGLYDGKISDFEPRYVLNVLLSIPISFAMSLFIHYDVVQLYLVCLVAILCYNYLVTKLLINCHGSFTLGEVQVIAQGVIVFVFNSLTSLRQLDEHHFYASSFMEAVDLLMLLHLGLLLLVCCLTFVPPLRRGLQLHVISFGIAISATYIWSYFYGQNALRWLLQFCFINSKRINIFIFWLMSVCACVFFVTCVSQGTSPSTSTIDRKYFHIIMDSVYIPGVIYDVQFLSFASGIVLGAFVVLEIYRILNVPIIGAAVGRSFEVFLDEKDSGALILTHIYLLVGCTCPVWLSSYYVNKNEYHISLMSGIISVGFGDTFAAVGGTLLGKHTWKGSSKTLEGTACAVIAQLISSLFFLYIGHDFSLFNVTLVVASVLLTSLVEAKTDQIDNLVLPLFMFSMLSWIQ